MLMADLSHLDAMHGEVADRCFQVLLNKGLVSKTFQRLALILSPILIFPAMPIGRQGLSCSWCEINFVFQQVQSARPIPRLLFFQCAF